MGPLAILGGSCERGTPVSSRDHKVWGRGEDRLTLYGGDLPTSNRPLSGLLRKSWFLMSEAALQDKLAAEGLTDGRSKRWKSALTRKKAVLCLRKEL